MKFTLRNSITKPVTINQDELYFDIKIFKAVDYPDLSQEFYERHAAVLSDYGIKNVTSSKAAWISNEHVYCTALINSDGEMVGGARIEIAAPGSPLPIELAVGKEDSMIVRDIMKDREQGVGEMCGMWTSKEIRGLGLSNSITRHTVFLLHKLNIAYAFCLVSEHTKSLVHKFGFRPAVKYGHDGKFNYPDNRYIATVLSSKDIVFPDQCTRTETKYLNELHDGKRHFRELYMNHFLNFDVEICVTF